MKYIPDMSEVIIDELKDLRKEALQLTGKDREETLAVIKAALTQVFESPSLTKREISEMRDLIEETKIILAKLLK